MIKYVLVLGHIPNMEHLSIIIYDQICFSIGSHTKYGTSINNGPHTKYGTSNYNLCYSVGSHTEYGTSIIIYD